MDDAKLKYPDTDYFDELLARNRDIRSSEKLFYRKVLNIYATSVDYDPKADASERFFKLSRIRCTGPRTKTAAEVVRAPADANPNRNND